MLTTAPSDVIRLHITPLNDEIYSRIIPASLAQKVANVSLHALQTFPERGFGYVDMPRADADQLRKKLNGSTLKGTKIRIEEARPPKKRISLADEQDDDQATTQKRRKTDRLAGEKPKTGVAVQGILPGYQLNEHRHVKRAWTDATASRAVSKKSRDSTETKDTKKSRSVPISDRKLLFKTTLPPNKTALVDPKAKKAAIKKSKDGAKKPKSSDKRTTIKESTSSRKSFAVSNALHEEQRSAVFFVEGKGWLDEDGEVVEPAPRSTRLHSAKLSTTLLDDAPSGEDESTATTVPSAPTTEQATDQDTSEEEATPASPPLANIQEPQPAQPADDAITTEESADEDSISEASDSSSSSEEDDDNESSVSEQDEDEEEAVEESPREIHPFEALYKKKPDADKADMKANLAPINTSFSFFGGTTDDTADTESGIVSETFPQTPHTKKEFEWRAQRSAAPTPDTAAIDGRFGFPFGPEEDEDDEQDDKDDVVQRDSSPSHPSTGLGISNVAASGPAVAPTEESTFRKYFYEHRGENDRAWKKKRREAKKVQRQRDNRRLSRKVV